MRVLSELSGVAVFHMVASFEQIQDRESPNVWEL